METCNVEYDCKQCYFGYMSANNNYTCPVCNAHLCKACLSNYYFEGDYGRICFDCRSNYCDVCYHKLSDTNLYIIQYGLCNSCYKQATSFDNFEDEFATKINLNNELSYIDENNDNLFKCETFKEQKGCWYDNFPYCDSDTVDTTDDEADDECSNDEDKDSGFLSNLVTKKTEELIEKFDAAYSTPDNLPSYNLSCILFTRRILINNNILPTKDGNFFKT